MLTNFQNFDKFWKFWPIFSNFDPFPKWINTCIFFPFPSRLVVTSVMMVSTSLMMVLTSFSNAGRSSMTTITHIALLLWFEIGIWPPPLPRLPDFSPEIKKSPQTNESRCDLSYVITQLKLSVLSLVQTTVGFGNLVSLSTKKSKVINDLQKSDCYSLIPPT